MSFLECGGVVHHYAFEPGFGAASRARSTGGGGGAPSVVFVNALGTDLRIWDEVVALLPQGWSVLRYDVRGHGGSEIGETPYSVEGLAADLAALLEALGLEAVIVCGLSLGGLVAQALAIAEPRRVAALCLCGTALRIGSREAWRERIERVRAEGLAAIADAVLARWFAPGFREREPAACRGYRGMLERMAPEGYMAAAHALGEADLGARAGTITVPTVVIAGELDPATPVELGRALAAAIRGARFETLPGASHLMCVEQPAALARAIVDLAARIDGLEGRLEGVDASRLAAGERVRRAVLGAAHVERAARAATEFDRDFQEYITRAVWGEVWLRPGLPIATRHLITIAVLAALGRQEELALHVGATPNTGVAPEQVKEVLMHVGAYAGVPAAHAALKIAKRALYGEGSREP